MCIRDRIIGVIGLGFLFLWLHLVGWVGGFLRVFRHLGFSISGTGYLLVTLIGLLTIFISWVRGLFYYVAITPNYMNLQEGPTETGEQISREDYNTRIDTGDFVERLFGFGRIVITFKEKSRLPLTLLTWNIQGKAQMLERVRAKFAVDLPQQRPAPAPVFPPAGPPPHPRRAVATSTGATSPAGACVAGKLCRYLFIRVPLSSRLRSTAHASDTPRRTARASPPEAAPRHGGFPPHGDILASLLH